MFLPSWLHCKLVRNRVEKNNPSNTFRAATAQVTFTGHADFDFNKSRLSVNAQKAYLLVMNGDTIPLLQSESNSEVFLHSGWDVDNIYFQYDYFQDILHIGVECFGICGDSDGDGNPGNTFPPNYFPDSAGGNDIPNLGNPEVFSMAFWPNPPASYSPTGDLNTVTAEFYPTFVVGVQQSDTIVDFNAYGFSEPSSCSGLTPPFARNTQCSIDHSQTVFALGAPDGYGVPVSIIVRSFAVLMPTNLTPAAGVRR